MFVTRYSESHTKLNNVPTYIMFNPAFLKYEINQQNYNFIKF